MGLVLKHVSRTKTGSFHYRRRVPKAVAQVITQREFKGKLGDSEREALASYPRFHAEIERQIADAAKRIQQAAYVRRPDATEREAYEEARRLRKALPVPDDDPDTRDLVAEHLLSRYHRDAETGEPVGVPAVERHLVRLLASVPVERSAPPPTLNDALRLYLKERLRADDPGTDQRPVGLAKRVIEAAIRAIGRDAVLVSLTREDARNVRDEMLDRIKRTGRGVGQRVSPATVSRELSIIAAVVNFGKTEYGLPDTFSNPFNSLPVSSERGKGAHIKAADRRDPFPDAVLTAVRERVLRLASVDLQLIWRILQATGCRLAEVTGLRVEDVRLDHEVPHIRLEPHPLRGLKTESSRRAVPLVGDALTAAQEAMKLPREGHMLFPSYGRVRGSDAASAALMKHVRKVTTDGRHVIHSLRHNMKDWLNLAEATPTDQNLILGHALSEVGDRVYGGETRKLRTMQGALMKALG